MSFLISTTIFLSNAFLFSTMCNVHQVVSLKGRKYLVWKCAIVDTNSNNDKKNNEVIAIMKTLYLALYKWFYYTKKKKLVTR